MDRRDYITVFRRKGMVGGSHMGGLRSGSSLHSKLFSTTLRRRQTITPIKAEGSTMRNITKHPNTLAPLLRLWEAWKSFARAMGGFQSRILLGLFYFLIVTPFGIGVRVFGDPLLLRRARRSSNWVPRSEATEAGLNEARKQF